MSDIYQNILKTIHATNVAKNRFRNSVKDYLSLRFKEGAIAEIEKYFNRFKDNPVDRV